MPRDTSRLYISRPHSSHNDSSVHVTTQPMSSNGHATGPAQHSSGLGATAIGWAANPLGGSGE